MTSISINRQDGLSSATSWKGPCRVATTANIALSDLQIVDGVNLVGGDRVLVKNQTDGRYNGIWVADSGLWRRAKDFSSNRDVRQGTQVFVVEGETYNRSGWYVSSDDPVIFGTTDIEFTQNMLVNSGQLEELVEQAQQAASEADQDRIAAEEAAAAAAAAAGNNWSSFTTVSSVQSANIPAPVSYLRTSGYYAPGDGGGALYKRVITEPTHAGKIQSADGAWWELAEIDINIRQFGAKLDGATDDYQSFMNAVEFKDKMGGGEVRLTTGVMATSTPIKIGDGSAAQVSTKCHRIVITGEGGGGHDGLDFVQQVGASEILYIGPTTTQPVFELAGPLHSVGLRDFVVNADANADIGIRINHVTDSVWSNVTTKRCRIVGWDYTTRSGFPSGCVYGTGNNIAFHCYNVEPVNGNSSGIKLSSGVSEAVTLTGQPDTANCDFFGGVYFYGGSANSEGVLLHGADNNTFYGTQFIPAASPSFGYSVRFKQWSGDTRFPMENVFTSLGAKDPVGGASGTLGNTFTIFQEGDGAALPTLPYVNVLSHSGVQIINGERVFRSRRIDQKISVTTQATNSNTYVPITGYQSNALTAVRAGSKLRVNFTGKVGKVSAGSGSFIIRRNGADEGSTEIDIPFNASYQNASISIILSVNTTADQAVGVYFKSSDANNVSIVNGVLTVEEMY